MRRIVHISRPMEILYNILLFVFVFVCVLLTLVVLMQRPKQEGLGAAFAGGMMNDSFGAQTTDVLQKGTQFFAVCFFGVAVVLAVMQPRVFQGEAAAAAVPDSEIIPTVVEDPAVVPPTTDLPEFKTPSITPEVPVPTPASTEEAPAPDETPATAETETAPPATADATAEPTSTPETAPEAPAAPE